MRNTPKIVVTLGGNSWEDIMGLIVEASRGSRIEDLPERANIAKDCRKCRSESMGKLQWILGEYFLGPEERAEILERMR